MKNYEKYTEFKKGELLKRSGVYCITNLITNMMYIGESVNLEERINYHINKLINNKHINTHLQNSVNKHSLNNFAFTIVEFCKPSITKEREDFWVRFLKSINNNCVYNIKPTDAIKINLRSAETSKKIYETKKRKADERGYWHSKESIEKRKITRKGYTHSVETRLKIGIKSKGRKIPKSKEWRDNMSKLAKERNWGGKNKRKIIQLTKTGEFIKEWNSISEAAKTLNIYTGGIADTCNPNNRLKTYKGYVWKYKEM